MRFAADLVYRDPHRNDEPAERNELVTIIRPKSLWVAAGPRPSLASQLETRHQAARGHGGHRERGANRMMPWLG